jgi:hypothetical protein
MRYIFLLLLIAGCVGIFIAIIIPRYDVINSERAQLATYNADLVTAGQLQQSRDTLIAQYNNINQADITNIETLLPDSVDDIRLIIQLDSLATKNNLSSLRNVNYDPDQVPSATTASGSAPVPANSISATPTLSPAVSQSPYGQFVISFQTSGQYSNFLSFLSDLEQNLRLVDVTDIEFTPAAATTGTSAGISAVPTAASGLGYKVTLTTYWLKQ